MSQDFDAVSGVCGLWLVIAIQEEKRKSRTWRGTVQFWSGTGEENRRLRMSTAHQEPIPILSDWAKLDPTKTIEYRFLDLDRDEFCETQDELLERYRNTPNTISRVIPAALHHNQVLVVSASRDFSAQEAVRRCRQLTGMLPAED